MAPDILAVMTPDLRENAPEPLLYHDLVYETGFDPWEPWYPCGCPHRLDDIHVDDCWLDWLALPMREDTTEVSSIAMPPPGAGGWCAPAETMNWCGHPLRENCGCEFTPVPASEVVIDLSQDNTVLLGVMEPLDEDDTAYFERHHGEPTSDVDTDEERSDDGDVRGAAAQDTVDGGDG